MTSKLIIVCLGVVAIAAWGACSKAHHPSGRAEAITFDPAPDSPGFNEQLAQVSKLNFAAETALNGGNYVKAEADASQSVSINVASGLGRELLAAALDEQGNGRKPMQEVTLVKGLPVGLNQCEY